MPLTLIDGSSRANIARDLAAIGASMHAKRPCYAQAIQRFAQQISDSFTAAQAVSGYTTAPAFNATFTDVTLADTTFSECSFVELVASGA